MDNIQFNTKLPLFIESPNSANLDNATQPLNCLECGQI